MAYDEELAGRVRELMAGESGVSETKMFGGLGLMVNGNMAVAVRGQGGLLVRVDPAESEELLDEPGASLMEMRGRAMAGWVTVERDAVEDGEALARWVARGVGYAKSLPPK